MERGLEFFNLALGELRKQAGQMVQLVQIFILAQIVIEPQHIAVKSVFFQYAPDLEHREIVNKVIESKEMLQVAGNLLMSISQNERERAIFRSRRKF